MNSKRYDVLCFGAAGNRETAELAVAGLSSIFGIDPEQAKGLLAKSGVTLRKGLSEDKAKELQAALLGIGVQSNYRPSSSLDFQNLDLVPIEEEKEGPPSTACPNCGFTVTGEDGQALPEVCPDCGVAFAKHDQWTAEQRRRDQLRRRLLAKVKAEEARAKAEADRLERAARDRQIEEEVRRQLGLPKILNTRARVAGAGGCLMLAGLLLGAVGSHFVGSSEQPLPADGMAVDKAAGASQPEPWLAEAGVSATQDPGVELLAAIEAAGPVSGAVLPFEANAREQGPLDPALAAQLARVGKGEGLEGAELPGQGRPAQGTRSAGGAVKQNAGGTPFNPDIVEALTAQSTGERAEALEALGRLALHLRHSGNAPGADALVAEMVKRVERLPAGLAKVRAAATLSYFQRTLGNADAADGTFGAGRQQAEQLAAGVDRALGLASLAAQAIRGGQIRAGEPLFRQANQALLRIPDADAKLRALCELATDYALAGRQGTAVQVLDYVQRGARAARPPADQRDLLQTLALAQARLDDLSGAWDTVRAIDDQGVQQSVLHQVTVKALAAGHLTWGSELAGHLRVPAYAAPAYARLGLARAVDGLDGSEAFAKAEYWGAQVAAADQVGVLGEFGQVYRLAGREAKATSWFADAQRVAKRIEDPAQRDRALAELAEYQAGALLADEASATASLLRDAQARVAVQADIEASRRLAALLRR